MDIKFSISWKIILLAIGGLAVLLGIAFAGSEYYTAQSSFCGTSCHTMDEQWQAWKNSKHYQENNAEKKEVGCVDCHEHGTLKSKFVGLRHLAAYLVDPKAPIPKSPVVQDGTCLLSGCHAKEEFQDKEIRYTEKVTFKHRAHFEQEALEGQTLTCDSCHIKHTAEKHFEVPQEICFLCHFKKNEYNEGAAECALCHTVPTKSLQQQKSADDPDEKPITHQTLEEANVSCRGCHLQHIKNEGDINRESCRGCHNASDILAKWEDQGLMHDEHVATRQADCFDCHRTDLHKAKHDSLELVRADCVLCHTDQHRVQKQLLLGEEREDVSGAPGLMRAVSTNCKGCHTDKEHKRGSTVMQGSGKACAGCHTPQHEQMLEDWRESIVKEIKFIREVEEEARRVLETAPSEVPDETLTEAKVLFDKGLENLHIVEHGNGVHNKKYSLMLLDAALTRFEEIVDLLAAGE